MIFIEKMMPEVALVRLRIVKEICDKNSVIIDLDSNEEETKFTYRFTEHENTTA